MTIQLFHAWGKKSRWNTVLKIKVTNRAKEHFTAYSAYRNLCPIKNFLFEKYDGDLNNPDTDTLKNLHFESINVTTIAF